MKSSTKDPGLKVQNGLADQLDCLALAYFPPSHKEQLWLKLSTSAAALRDRSEGKKILSGRKDEIRAAIKVLKEMRQGAERRPAADGPENGAGEKISGK